MVKNKENTDTYDSDAYIIGSSNFDGDCIVTGTMPSRAGAWSILSDNSVEKFTELSEQETNKFIEKTSVWLYNLITKFFY